MTTAYLALDGLSKRFGATRAVDKVSLSAGTGEFIALLGPSGCGKTTIMRMIAGIVPPDAGAIHLAGRDLGGLPPERRGIGLVFQSYALFPHMSVAENIGFGLRMRRIAGPERDRRVRAALELVDLADYGARLPRALSGGQQQRVALARAIAIEPALLLLDEPLSNLDAKLREQLRGELKRLQRRLGVTAIHVTHDQSEALALADRIVVMNRGRIVESGTPVDLYRQPRHRFTAEFLGVTNLLPATAVAGTARLGDGSIVALPGHATATPTSVTIAIRPEDLGIAAATDGPARVDDVVFHGGETEYFLDAPALVVAPGRRLRVRVAGASVPLPPGTPVSLVYPPAVHLIEADDEAGR
ncbi:MAG: ABC transporter ATP-binding protein [Hyphomicrobiaceae bacterium]|nr:ABC transporter ATP-binding protein [Hyphomicrobiaceae bacterium]